MRDPFSKIGRKFKKKRLPQNAETLACPPAGNLPADKRQALQNLLPVFALDAPKNRKGFPLFPTGFRFKQTIGFARPFSYTVNIPFRVTCAVRPVNLFAERLTLFELLCFSRQLLYTAATPMSNDLKAKFIPTIIYPDLVFIYLASAIARPDRYFAREGINFRRKSILSVC